jgi:hypothetical protein
MGDCSCRGVLVEAEMVWWTHTIAEFGMCAATFYATKMRSS